MANRFPAKWTAPLLASLLLGANAEEAPPQHYSAEIVDARACRTASATIRFDFPGASASACAIEGERAFAILITPEHAPPINPSPWYAFRYEASGTEPISVTLRYLGGQHRYDPKWSGGKGWRELAFEMSEDGESAVMRLPPGSGLVAAQEIVTPQDTALDLQRWSAMTGARVLTLGHSHDGRPIEGLRLGREEAPRLVILLGRQHPPEVTGAIAMQAFVDALADKTAVEGLDDIQFLIVPMLNPDGAVRGHWRANRGAVDLNRDWGLFTQPETRGVKAWLDAMPSDVRPELMLDFHSTHRNLFYVQGDEASRGQQRFLAAWLEGKERAFPGYPFTIEPRNANPGSGTAKNWFHETFAIPAYTYEVADTADRAATRGTARELALRLLDVLGAPGDGAASEAE